MNRPKPMVILIAGPYRSGTNGDPLRIAQNLDRLESFALSIYRAGHIPVIGEWVALPLMKQAGSLKLGDEISEQYLYPVASRLLERCDAVLRIEGESKGADEDLRLARERGLDLVEISPTADPPVCKITDYGKYLYQESKKKHEQRKHQKATQLKEVKFRPSTAEHDFQVRKNQIIRFLGEGHKVKAMIFHRGREMAHQEVGRAKMHRLLGEIADHALVEIGPRMEANVLMALLAPKRGGTPVKPAGAPAGQ